MEEKNPFTTTTKKIKYLGKNLKRNVQNEYVSKTIKLYE